MSTAHRSEIEQRLELRMHRQDLLTQKGAPDLWIILDEAALHRPVGGPAVMRKQLQRLIDVSALPKITLQVLRFSADPHAGLDGDFTLYSFSDPADPDLVFIENSGGDLYLEDTDRTQRYRLIRIQGGARYLAPPLPWVTMAPAHSRKEAPWT